MDIAMKKILTSQSVNKIDPLSAILFNKCSVLVFKVPFLIKISSVREVYYRGIICLVMLTEK